jgi:hypothetical protein
VAHIQGTVASLPLRYFQRLAVEADYQSSDFWELARQLGNSVQQYTDRILHDAGVSNAATAASLRDFKDTMTQLVSSTKDLRDEVHKHANLHGLSLETISEMLSTELAIVLEELKAEFPAPDEADHHEKRVEMVSRALMKIEGTVIRVSGHCGISEADARTRFRDIEPHIRRVIVVVGKPIWLDQVHT